MKENCWEFKKCGRQPQGLKSKELSVCPASINEKLDGINGGVNAGRSCWVIAGTFCGGEIQGSYAHKLNNCMECDFYKKVRDDQINDPEGYMSSKELLSLLADS